MLKVSLLEISIFRQLAKDVGFLFKLKNLFLWFVPHHRHHSKNIHINKYFRTVIRMTFKRGLKIRLYKSLPTDHHAQKLPMGWEVSWSFSSTKTPGQTALANGPKEHLLFHLTRSIGSPHKCVFLLPETLQTCCCLPSACEQFLQPSLFRP